MYVHTKLEVPKLDNSPNVPKSAYLKSGYMSKQD